MRTKALCLWKGHKATFHNAKSFGLLITNLLENERTSPKKINKGVKPLRNDALKV